MRPGTDTGPKLTQEAALLSILEEGQVAAQNIKQLRDLLNTGVPKKPPVGGDVSIPPRSGVVGPMRRAPESHEPETPVIVSAPIYRFEDRTRAFALDRQRNNCHQRQQNG